MSNSDQRDSPIDRCPFCEDEGVESKGRYEGRVLIGGRGMYICPKNDRHRWQNADEKPTTCGVTPIRG